MGTVAKVRERYVAVREVPRRRRQVRLAQMAIVALALIGLTTPDLLLPVVGGSLAVGVAVSRMRNRWALSDRVTSPDS